MLFVFAGLFVINYATGLELAKQRVENAFRTGDISAVEDLLSNTVALRIENNLFQSISQLTCVNELNKYLDGKEIVSFKLRVTNSGDLTYIVNGEKKTIPVEIRFASIGDNDVVITGINVSEKPINRAFDKY